MIGWKPLEDGHTLEDYGIESDDDVILRLHVPDLEADLEKRERMTTLCEVV